MSDPPDLAALLAELETRPVARLPDAIAMLERTVARCWARLGVERHTMVPRTRQWLRAREAAPEYGLAVSTLYDWSHKRTVRTKKVGKAKSAPVLFWRPDLERRTRTRPALRPRVD